jgi:dTDP-6-deoxy-L-talose 4-dehydrogenase (NAD+)
VNRVAVIGANGFLGTTITNRFNIDGWEVLPTSRLNSTQSQQKLSYVDIYDEASIDDFLLKNRPELVISTAWETEHGKFWNKETNIEYAAATTRLASRCYELGVLNFIGLGTMSEYGQAPGPCDSKITPLNPSDLYSKTKSETGIQLKEIAESFGRQFSWLRVFQAFGPKEKELRFIPTLIRTLGSGNKIEISSPHNKMDWIHSEDVASALSFSIANELFGFIDIGTGVSTSVADVSKEVSEIFGFDESLLVFNTSENPIKKNIYVSESSQILKLGWKPEKSLADRLRSLPRFN